MNAFYIRMSVLLQRMRIFVFRRAGTGRSKGSAVHNRRHDSGNSSPGCDMLKQIMRARRAYWMQAGLPATMHAARPKPSAMVLHAPYRPRYGVSNPRIV